MNKCMSCGGGIEFFDEKKEDNKEETNGICLFTAQGEMVCNVNTEYQKWLINDKNEYSAPFGFHRVNTFTGFNLK